MICAKDNPFAVSRIEGLGYIPFTEPLDVILRRLAGMQFTAAIVGPCGSGKTTLLEELEKRLRSDGILTETVFISNDVVLPWRMIWEKAASVPAGGVLFFDGACHLSRWRWMRLRRLVRRRNIGLVITSHREGMLSTLVYCRPRPQMLTEIVKQLLGDIDQNQQAECMELFEIHRGNIRDCLRQLYDRFAEQDF